MQFSHKIPLYFFYTMVQKVKNDQKLKSRGGGGVPALKPFRRATPSSVSSQKSKLEIVAGAETLTLYNWPLIDLD